MAAATDLVVVHNKAQFMSMLFEALATVKQMPASLRNHMTFARSTCRNFLKPHQRLQRIAQQKMPLDKAFDNAGYTVASDVVKKEASGSAALLAAMGKVEEAVKGSKQPMVQETVDVLQELSKVMQIPQPVLKPTLDSMVSSGAFDITEIDEVASKIPANPFTPDQVWDAVADRMEATKDGRVASMRKLGKSSTVQQNVTKAGYFQIVDVPKDKQFAMMPITPGLANHMACGPQRPNFTHLNACDHPAARALIEDLTNILLIGTNVADADRDRSVAVTLRSMSQDPMAVSFRTIIDKSVAQGPSGKQPLGGTQKSAVTAPGPAPAASAKSQVGGAPPDTNIMEVFDKLKQMGQGVSVQVEMLEAVFAQLVAGNVATPEEVEKAKAELKTRADDKGQVSFPAIQEVFMMVFGSKIGGQAK